MHNAGDEGDAQTHGDGHVTLSLTFAVILTQQAGDSVGCC